MLFPAYDWLNSIYLPSNRPKDWTPDARAATDFHFDEFPNCKHFLVYLQHFRRKWPYSLSYPPLLSFSFCSILLLWCLYILLYLVFTLFFYLVNHLWIMIFIFGSLWCYLVLPTCLATNLPTSPFHGCHFPFWRFCKLSTHLPGILFRSDKDTSIKFWEAKMIDDCVKNT